MRQSKQLAGWEMTTNGNWPHQDKAKAEIAEARAAGEKAIICVAPCGAGKSRIMQQLTTEEVARGGRVRIYLHRSMLKEQLSNVFTAAGIDHGILAAGSDVEIEKPVQICMADSVYARAIVRSRWDLGEPTLTLWDEAHQQTGNKARSILIGGVTESGMTWKGHLARGSTAIGFSATPVNCGDIYQKVVYAGSYSEMRRVKAHLQVRVYSPSEIDCQGIGRSADYEFSSRQLEPRAYAIFGDAYAWWKRLNPDARPAILFAPSVAASRWFANEWAKMGVPVAHIDGETCLLPRRNASGAWTVEQYDSCEEIRNEILAGSRSGEIKVVMNRFVLREAIDMPWIYHGIAATAFGAISSYLQSVGRIQRYWPEYDHKVWQCHGGSYWRHGSPNIDREWKLGATNKSIAEDRLSRIRKSGGAQEIEGICCPKCACWRQHGTRCPSCGHTHSQSIRSVRMINGDLKLMKGDVNKAKRKKGQTSQKIWDGVLWGSAQVGRSVSSAVTIWRARCADAGIAADIKALRNAPPPSQSLDYHRLVSDVFPWCQPRHRRKNRVR